MNPPSASAGNSDVHLHQSNPKNVGTCKSDVVTIEYCTAPRPSASLRGTPEEFELHALALKVFLEKKFPNVVVTLQKPPYGRGSKVPSTELKLRFADENVYVPTRWAGGHDGHRMPLSSEGRRRFPRINAFEVTANGRAIYSKLVGGPVRIPQAYCIRHACTDQTCRSLKAVVSRRLTAYFLLCRPRRFLASLTGSTWT